MSPPQWIKGTYQGVYTEMRDDGPWTLIDDGTDDPVARVVPEDEAVSFEPVFEESVTLIEEERARPDEVEWTVAVGDEPGERVTPTEEPPPTAAIESMIDRQLASIDHQIAQLVAERETVNGEIRRLRAERVPVARLANAAKPRKPRVKAVPDEEEPPGRGGPGMGPP